MSHRAMQPVGPGWPLGLACSFSADLMGIDQARIRVKFADQTMVESSLPSSSRLDALYTSVSSVLNEAAQSSPFLLCMLSLCFAFHPESF